MEHFKVSLRVVACLMFFITVSLQCYAQSAVSKEIVSNLYDLDTDSGKAPEYDSAIFIVVTNKNCIKCFNDVCRYFEKNNEQYKISGVIVMPKNYLELIPVAQKYADELKCAQKFFFYFITANMRDEIRSVAEMPSPQLIIKTKENYHYYSYKETLNLTGSK